MKKHTLQTRSCTKATIFLSVFCLVGLNSPNQFELIQFNSLKNENMQTRFRLVKKQASNGGPVIFDNNFDISQKGSVEEFEDFTGKENYLYGKVSKIDDPVSYKVKNFVTYESHWAPWQDAVTEPYNVKRYETYTFSRYVNVPIKIVDRIEMEPKQTMTYEMSEQTTTTESGSTTSVTASSVTTSCNIERKIQLGAGIPLENIRASGSVSSTEEIGVSQTLSQTVTTTSTKTYQFSKVITKKWELDNSHCSERRIFQFNYRQKFKLYFTTEYDIKYKTTTWGSGAFNLDTHHSYDPEPLYPSIRTVFFLVPMSEPTFGCTTYCYDKNGNEKPVLQFDKNIVYL